MEDVYKRFEHAGMIVEILYDHSGAGDPQEGDNAGQVYSWTRDFSGDKVIPGPDNEDEGLSLRDWFEQHYDCALMFPLWFEDYRYYSGIGFTDRDPNAALVFTHREMREEWRSVEDAAAYARDRIEELDHWLHGDVWCIRIRERTRFDRPPEEDAQGAVLETVCGFVGDPYGEFVQGEAEQMAEDARESIDREREEVNYWAARDVITVDA